MPLVLNQTSAPATNPVTLAEAKLWLRMDESDLDDVISELITSATLFVETHTNRQLVTATYALNLDRFPYTTIPRSGVRIQQIELPRAPLQSVSSIQYYDPDGNQQTLATSVYSVDTSSEPGRVYLADGQSWPDIDTRPEAVTTTFVAGYGAASAVPSPFKTMIKMLVKHWFSHDSAVSCANLAEVPLQIRHLIWANKVPTAA